MSPGPSGSGGTCAEKQLNDKSRVLQTQRGDGRPRRKLSSTDVCVLCRSSGLCGMLGLMPQQGSYEAGKAGPAGGTRKRIGSARRAAGDALAWAQVQGLAGSGEPGEGCRGKDPARRWRGWADSCDQQPRLGGGSTSPERRAGGSRRRPGVCGAGERRARRGMFT